MAQYSVSRGSHYPGGNGDIFETFIVSTADGSIVTTSNPLPVTLGSDSITITGNVNVGTTVEISNDEGAPIPTHAHFFDENDNEYTTSNPLTVDGTVNIGNLPSTQTIDGTVNIATIPEVEVKNDAGNPLNVVGTLSVTPVETAIDGFGRQRVSTPFTLGDYKHLYGIDPNFRDILTSGGAVAHDADQAAARLSVTGTTGSKVIHQTKAYHHYMPGKSQAILSSFNFRSAVTGIRKRTGYFDDKNGIFFEQDTAGLLAFNIRSHTSGAPDDVTNRVLQTNWNIDKCDGTGISGYDIDISKTQLFFADFQWLGVGRVRVGFVHDGKFIVAHEFYNSNNKSEVYMSNPNLPIRCEIENVEGGSATSMDQICSTVFSEGGYVETGQDWAIASPTLRTLSASATLPIMCIRLKNNYNGYDNRLLARLGDCNILTTSTNVQFSIVKLDSSAQLTGGTWVSVNDDSGLQYNSTATSVSGGDTLDAGFVTGSSQGSKQYAGSSGNHPSTAKKNYIAQNFDSTDSEIYAIVVKNLETSSTTVGVTLQWREVY